MSLIGNETAEKLSPEKLLWKYPCDQLAYFVPDVKEAAKRHSLAFGTGPWYILERIEGLDIVHRGEPVKMIQSVAYTYWGDIELEFCQQHDPGPSYFRDMFPNPGDQGFHHTCLYASDMETGLKEVEAAGFEIVTIGSMGKTIIFAFADARKEFGHYLEIKPHNAARSNAIKKLTEGWTGWDGKSELFRYELPGNMQ